MYVALRGYAQCPWGRNEPRRSGVTLAKKPSGGYQQWDMVPSRSRNSCRLRSFFSSRFASSTPT